LPRPPEFRDYLYVSARKVVRMSRTLPNPVWKRVRDLQVKLGPVGAGLTLDSDSRAEDVIALVPEVERAIDEHFGITYVTDPELGPGEWFLIEATPMIYGVVLGLPDNYGVVFIGADGNRFVLGGSADYLLDRPSVEREHGHFSGYARSAFGGIIDTLVRLVDYDQPKSDHAGDGLEEQRQIVKGHLPDWFSLSNMFRAFEGEEQGLEPLTALARCVEIDIDQHDGKKTVIGTPLYVEFDASR